MARSNGSARDARMDCRKPSRYRIEVLLAKRAWSIDGDWVHRYNQDGVAGLRDRPRPGRPCGLDEGQQAALEALVLNGPRLKRDGCVAWRLRDLCDLVERRFGRRDSETGMLRLVRGLDLSRQKARPVHPGPIRRRKRAFGKLARADPRGGDPPPRGRAGRAVVRR
jgi:transposase